MRRQPLLQLLERYRTRFPDESATLELMRRFVSERDDCFQRSCLEGHVTASAWIVSADHERVLLTHHRKLGVWLQLGGHADGESDTARVALCEAREESGLDHFVFCPDASGLLPLDVDVHAIPARSAEPAHQHHDVCYLLLAAADQPLVMSSESHDLRWFSWDDAAALVEDTSQLRKARKARARLGL